MAESVLAVVKPCSQHAQILQAAHSKLVVNREEIFFRRSYQTIAVSPADPKTPVSAGVVDGRDLNPPLLSKVAICFFSKVAAFCPLVGSFRSGRFAWVHVACMTA